MTAAALIVAMSLTSLNPVTHAGLLLAQEDLPPPPPPPPSEVTPPPAPPPAPSPSQSPPMLLPAADRELTIKALREEVAELSDQKSNIGFAFPIICIGLGVGAIALGSFTTPPNGFDGLKTGLLVGGTIVAALSTFWFIWRLVKSISLGNQISDKEEQLRRLEGQRPGATGRL